MDDRERAQFEEQIEKLKKEIQQYDESERILSVKLLVANKNLEEAERRVNLSSEETSTINRLSSLLLGAFISTFLTLYLFLPVMYSAISEAIISPCFRTILCAVCVFIAFSVVWIFIALVCLLAPLLIAQHITDLMHLKRHPKLTENVTTILIVAIGIVFAILIYIGIRQVIL